MSPRPDQPYLDKQLISLVFWLYAYPPSYALRTDLVGIVHVPTPPMGLADQRARAGR